MLNYTKDLAKRYLPTSIYSRLRPKYHWFKMKVLKKVKAPVGPLYKHFRASSTNDIKFRETWVHSASMFIPQLHSLLNDHLGSAGKIEYIENYRKGSDIALKDLLDKHGSDKANNHNYYIFYSYVLKLLGVESEINLLEIGLGTNNPKLLSSMGKKGVPGASLRAFREYLPNANIYGGDIDRDILFSEDRIQTSFVNQMNAETFLNMQRSFNSPTYDIIIDDGLHSIGANLNTLLFGLKNIKKNGWIIIEDIHVDSIETWQVVDFFVAKNKAFKTYILQGSSALLYAVNKKGV